MLHDVLFFSMGAITSALFLSLYDRLKPGRSYRIDEMYADVEYMAAKVLRDATLHTEITRAYSFMIHNSGGDPFIGNEKFMTITDEAVNHGVRRIKGDYFKFYFKDDESFPKTISDTIKSPRQLMMLDTALMPEGFMKRRLEADQIRTAFIFFLANGNKNMFFAVFETGMTPGEMVDSRRMAPVDTYVEKLRAVYREAERKKWLL